MWWRAEKRVESGARAVDFVVGEGRVAKGVGTKQVGIAGREIQEVDVFVVKGFVEDGERVDRGRFGAMRG